MTLTNSSKSEELHYMKTVNIEDDIHQRLAIEARMQKVSIRNLVSDAINAKLVALKYAQGKANS